MRNKLLILSLLMFSFSCSVYKAEKVYFFADSSKLQPSSIRIKIPQKGLINRQELFSTSLVDREINYLYKDSSFFYIKTDIPALGYINEDKFGVNEKSLFWRNFSNEKIIIGYKNVEKGKKEELDKIIELAVRKLEN